MNDNTVFKKSFVVYGNTLVLSEHRCCLGSSQYMSPIAKKCLLKCIHTDAPPLPSIRPEGMPNAPTSFHDTTMLAEKTKTWNHTHHET